ncbi:MAG: response regulator transcription factor [Chloroflexi bacterium]|nr:response regulator transcription factor [Chloroflexota bacterium]
MTSSPIIRILLVDDHAAVRSGLETFFAVQPTMELVGQASTTQQGLQLCAKLRPDIVLLDYWLPDMKGAQAIASLRQQSPHSKIVAISSSFTADQMQKIMAAGATATYAKTSPIAELLNLIPQIFQQQHHPPQPAPPAPIQLSQRERQVLNALAQGLDEATITEQLGLPAITLKFYKKRLLLKLNARSINDIVTYAHQQQLIPELGGLANG